MLRSISPHPKKYITDSSEFQRICAWCKRVKVEEDWLVMRPNENRPLTHGLCPACYNAMIAKLDREQ